VTLPPVSRFDTEDMPKHQGGGPTVAPDPDCCDKPECPQRDYNRMVMLSLLRLSQSYAGLLLLQRATRALWHCSDGVHTDCATPECTFGSVQAARVAGVTDALASVVTVLFEALARPATDLTGQWQEFGDMEVAAQGLEFLDEHDGFGDAAGAIFLDTLQRHVVDEDAAQFQRWFRPPPPES
jgi:hypothetical protein